MAAPSLLPAVDVLVQLRKPHRRNPRHTNPEECNEGHTLETIGQMYGVAKQSVYEKLRGRPDRGTETGVEIPGERKHKPSQDTIPWTVRPEHQQAWDAYMLRELSKHLANKTAGTRGRYLSGWLHELEAAGRVIDYDPEQGFIRVRRRKADGDGYIRQPKQPKRTRSAPG